MPDYSNGVIYKIIQRDGKGEFYIGSTCNLKHRTQQHKTACNLQNCDKFHYTLYEYIRANGGWINWQVEKIEDFACESKEELEIRERYWIEKERPSLNCRKPAAIALFESEREYRRHLIAENPEAYYKRKRELREQNKEKVNAQRRQRHQENPEIYREQCRKFREGKHREANLERKRQYYHDHKEEVREKQRRWREENREAVNEGKRRYYNEHKEQINERMRQPITCECGKVIKRGNLRDHRKSKYHLTHTPALTAVPTPTGGLGGVASGVGTNIEGKTVSSPMAVAAISARGSAPP
jgi:hypothetical protein